MRVYNWAILSTFDISVCSFFTYTIVHTNHSPAPCALGCAAPPLMQPVREQVFVVPALPPPHALECFVFGLPSGVLSFQVGHGLLKPPIAFAYVPCLPPAGHGGASSVGS